MILHKFSGEQISNPRPLINSGSPPRVSDKGLQRLNNLGVCPRGDKYFGEALTGREGHPTPTQSPSGMNKSISNSPSSWTSPVNLSEVSICLSVCRVNRGVFGEVKLSWVARARLIRVSWLYDCVPPPPPHPPSAGNTFSLTGQNNNKLLRSLSTES